MWCLATSLSQILLFTTRVVAWNGIVQKYLDQRISKLDQNLVIVSTFRSNSCHREWNLWSWCANLLCSPAGNVLQCVCWNLRISTHEILSILSTWACWKSFGGFFCIRNSKSSDEKVKKHLFRATHFWARAISINHTHFPHHFEVTVLLSIFSERVSRAVIYVCVTTKWRQLVKGKVLRIVIMCFSSFV